MLAQAMSSTSPTTAMRMRSGSSSCWRKLGSPVAAGALIRICLRSAPAVICGESTARRAFNCCRLTPGFTRPMTLGHHPERWSNCRCSFMTGAAQTGTATSNLYPTSMP